MGMTIAMGLKELKLIDRKVSGRQRTVRALCASLSDQKDTVENQKEKVASLTQSCLALITRKHDIKMAIQKANLNTAVSWVGKDYSLHEILFLKQMGAEMIRDTYKALDISRQEENLERRKAADTNIAITLNVHFDVENRDRHLEAHMDLMGNLDVLIDGANHQTEIDVEPYGGDEFDSEKE